ncbi:MAG: hypothetical protein L6R28_22380 [Planctomycetes bacterium]|nr:hypothetical protein [Planctomycetota bacterium]
MSESRQSRIAVLQHKQRQLSANEQLTRLSDKLGEKRHSLVDSTHSLRLQVEMHEKLRSMRVSRTLQSEAHLVAEKAVDALLARTTPYSLNAVGEFYSGSTSSGFFKGPFSRNFVLSCLATGYEGIALIEIGLSYGTILDVVHEDPMRGNFYEIEWW